LFRYLNNTNNSTFFRWLGWV